MQDWGKFVIIKPLGKDTVGILGFRVRASKQLPMSICLLVYSRYRILKLHKECRAIKLGRI